jgi:hypothetical protein
MVRWSETAPTLIKLDPDEVLTTAQAAELLEAQLASSRA